MEINIFTFSKCSIPLEYLLGAPFNALVGYRQDQLSTDVCCLGRPRSRPTNEPTDGQTSLSVRKSTPFFLSFNFFFIFYFCSVLFVFNGSVHAWLRFRRTCHRDYTTILFLAHHGNPQKILLISGRIQLSRLEYAYDHAFCLVFRPVHRCMSKQEH